jgi:hypothetical protein
VSDSNLHIHKKISTTSTKKTFSRGASLVEYALLIALIAVVCISAVRLVGRNAYYTLNNRVAPELR